MSVRTVILLAVAAMGLPAAFAHTAATFVGGEAGWLIGPPAPSALTRAEVRAELQRFLADPTGPDGGRYVGGEEGYVMPMHSYAYRDGHWVCTDRIAHNPAPAAIKSPLEQKLFHDTYPA